MRQRLALFAAWCLAFAAAVGLSTLVPPVQSPDEHAHLLRAYVISTGRLTLATDPALGTGAVVDTGLLAYVDTYLSTIARSAQTPVPPQRQAQAQALRWGAGSRFFPLAGTNYYLPLVYAPQAVAMLAGRTLDLTIAHTYRLVRVASILTCLLLLAAAWRILRPPPLAAALLLLPMTIFQMVSPTLDGTTTCLAVFTLSLFCAGATADNEWSPARSLLLAAAILLLTTSRIQLLPLLAMPFWIAWRRRTGRDAVLGAAVVLLTAAWLLYALATTVDVRVHRAQSTVSVLLYYLAAPMEFLRVVARSLADPQLGEFYARSFIGVLGWLDTLLPLWAYPALWTGLALCAAASLPSRALEPGAARRMLLLLGATGSSLLVFLALLLTWTPHPAHLIEGVQGRYFIVPAVMVAYAISAWSPSRERTWLSSALLIAFGGVSVWAFVATALARYH